MYQASVADEEVQSLKCGSARVAPRDVCPAYLHERPLGFPDVRNLFFEVGDPFVGNDAAVYLYISWFGFKRVIALYQRAAK